MMDEEHDIFLPDTILPSQYYNRQNRNPEFEPVVGLFRGILEDAIDCVKQKPNLERMQELSQPHPGLTRKEAMKYWQELARLKRAKETYDAAYEWIMLEGDLPLAFSFDLVCEGLGIEPAALREWVRDGHVTGGYIRRASVYPVNTRCEVTA